MTEGSLGSFEYFIDIHHQIRQNHQQFPAHRQVVSVLLLDPSKQQLCLTRSRSSDFDDDHRWSPPQGSIHRLTGIVRSARWHIKNKVCQTPNSRTIYLGSVLRKLSEPRGKHTHYHYHFVTVEASDHCLRPGKGVAEARWCQLDVLPTWVKDAMSPAKAAMFLQALGSLQGEAVQQSLMVA